MPKAAKRQKIRESVGPMDSKLHRRTFRFAVSLAASRAFPDRQLCGGHAVGEAYWYNFSGVKVTEEDVAALTKELQTMIDAELEIKPDTMEWEKAVKYFDSHNQRHAAKVLRTRASANVQGYTCDGHFRLALCPLFSNMAELENKAPYACELRHFKNGFLAVYGRNYVEQPAIVGSFLDHLNWGSQATGVLSVGDLNEVTIEKGQKGREDFSMAAEFRQDQKLTEIARIIHERNSTAGSESQVRVMAIAGPTSSGKTTFAHKLSLYLKNFGYESKALSVDHYYLNLEDQPKFKVRGERNDVDYDSIESMDVPMVNDHINRLIAGETVQTPVYDFKSGNRVPPGHTFDLPPKGILIIEGIHALNPDYTSGIDPQKVFKIYISPLTCLQIDDFNVLKTTTHRLLRRMCRDYKFRGYSAEHTLKKWEFVRRGEDAHIFKHQNNADYVMNSAMEHEVAILKTEVEPILSAVPPTSEAFDFAQDVLKWMSNIAGWPEREVAFTSIFREFLGNGAYDKH